jgi:CTP:molybdopterin cytidylyltransferase MocA
MTANVAGVLLAAGEGSRLGRPKALIVIDGQSLASRGAELLSTGGAQPVIVVSGAATPADLSPEVRVVHNPDWRTGMGSSLAVGLRAIPDDCTAAVLALADQPLVGPGAVRRLIQAHTDGASIVVAAYEGKPRNPVLIAREHWPEVIEMAVGDVGARPFLKARSALVRLIECGDTGRPDDIDTPDDLARMEEVLGGGTPFP